MAISLNNHETRIKALESQSSAGMQIVNIRTSAKYLSWSLAEFGILPTGVNALLVACGFGGDNIQWGCFTFVPVEIVKSAEFGIEFATGNNTSSTIGCKIDGTSIKFRKVTEGSGSDDDVIRRIYGLKLYYSFSYNIIYKILRSKISRLCQKFTLLKQKECEIIWL